jgi:hypothetical protein
MNPVARYKPLTQSNLPCPDVITMAERELSAFFNAVTQLFGAKQAELSAEDWLKELVEINGLPASVHEWRSLTAKVSMRLAVQMQAAPLSSSLFTEPQIA